jgi:uncharacterized protein YodC (DUF2158 family)
MKKIKPRHAIGTVVTINTGGQSMTITEYIYSPKKSDNYTGFVWCEWYDDNVLKRKKYHQDAISE